MDVLTYGADIALTCKPVNLAITSVLWWKYIVVAVLS